MPAVSATAAASHLLTQATGGGPDGGARVELAKLQREYSACVNCASADTPEGKLNIQRLETRIGSLQARIERRSVSAASSNEGSTFAASAVAKAEAANTNTAAPVGPASGSAAARQSVPPVGGSVGPAQDGAASLSYERNAAEGRQLGSSIDLYV